MLSCFLKMVGEESPTVFVDKFIERVWVHENGSATILRTVILGCRDNSGITGFVMVIPGLVNSEQVIDLSATGLDPSFHWNFKESNSFQIVDDQNREIKYDGLDSVFVPAKLSFDINHHGGFTLLEIALNKKIKPGQRVFVRIKIESSQFARLKNDKDLYFAHPYLSTEGTKVSLSKIIDFPKLQIPIIPLQDQETRAGGFDVFVTSPENMQIVAEPDSKNQPTKGLTDIEGKPIESRTSRVWRLRFVIDDPTKPIRAGNISMMVAADIIKNTQVIKLQELTEDFKKSEHSHRRRDTLAITISIIAILVAIFLYLVSR